MAKLDFKYGPDGRLYLFEINARLTLWAHPGARAGVEPARRSCTQTSPGAPRPQPRSTRACLDWVHPKDVLAARANGISMAEWLRWLWRTHPVTGVWRWDDPGPLLGMLAVRVKGAALGTSAATPD